MTVPDRSTLVRVAVVATLVLATAGLVAGHGSFAARLSVQETAGEGVPEPFLLDVSTVGADEVPEQYRSGSVAVEYRVFVGDRVVETGDLEMGFDSSRTLSLSHTFSDPGYRELSVNATFSLGGGEWTREFRSVRTVEVAAAGTERALSECTTHAGGDLFPPYRLQCYLTHRGLVAGLLPGLVASPVLAVVALLGAGGLAAVGLRVVGVDV